MKYAGLSAEEYASDRAGIVLRFQPYASALAFEMWTRGPRRHDLSELKSEAYLALTLAAHSWNPDKGDLRLHLTCHIKWQLLAWLAHQKPAGYRFSKDQAPSTLGLIYEKDGEEVVRPIQSRDSALLDLEQARDLEVLIAAAHLDPRQVAIIHGLRAGLTVRQLARRLGCPVLVLRANAEEIQQILSESKDRLASCPTSTTTRVERYKLIQEILHAPIGSFRIFPCLAGEHPRTARSRLSARLLSDRLGTYFCWSTRAIPGGVSVLKRAVRSGYETAIANLHRADRLMVGDSVVPSARDSSRPDPTIPACYFQLRAENSNPS